MKKQVFSILIYAMLLFLLLTGCGGNGVIQEPGTSTQDAETAEGELNADSGRERTWQEDCLHEDVSRAVRDLYLDGGSWGDLAQYHYDLSYYFEEGENLYVDLFNSYYNELHYDSMEQLEKDVLNGLLFYFGEGDMGFFDLDVPIEKAWMVGEGENNTNQQKHRKIVFKLNVPRTDNVGLEMDFWINDYDAEEHSANFYKFGDANDPNYDARTGINDVTSDSGIWANALRDYYNNETYVALDVNQINSIIHKNKEFLEFMEEYMDIYTDYQLELWEAEREAEEAKKSIQPAIGMTKDEVLEGAWGEPEKKNITETIDGVSEQWVYGNGKYIYFEDGIVTTIQRTE